ncbi:hypothetical protein ACA910_004006 [Epithemia clementina (nom. ined.)]
MIRSFQNNNSRISSSGGDDRTTTATKFVASQHTQKANHNTQSPTRSAQPQQETTITKTKEKQVMLAKVNGTAEKNASAIGTTAGHDNDGVIRDLNQVVANDTDEDSDKFVLASVAAPSSEDEDEDNDHELLTDCILPDLIPDSIWLARVDCTELYETGETLQKLLLLAHSPCRTPCCDNDDDDDDHHPYEAAAAAARQNQRILQTQQVSCSFGAALETFKERNHRFIQERAKKRRERKRLIQRWRKTQKKADVVVTIHSDDEDSFYSLESF